MRMLNVIKELFRCESSAEKLYRELNTDKFSERPYEKEDLGEDMTLVKEVIWQYWKPRFLMDHRVKQAFEFMDENEKLVTVSLYDIDWSSLENLPGDDVRFAKELNFHFPSFIYDYKNGVAEVRWQLNPDGMYYMDEDGFGMTDDVEVNIYGFIDRNGKVLVKFRNIKNDKELESMRDEAEKIIAQRE